MISAGKLNKHITLRQPIKTKDGMGGFTTAWTDAATPWAEFLKPKMQVLDVSGTPASVMTQEVKIRYNASVRRGWRMQYGGKTYAIEHTYDEGREATILVCREVVK